MARGYVYIAERDGPELRDLTASLERIGVHLANPSNGSITRLSDEGDQIETTENELAGLLSSETILTFQFWFSGDVDLGCSFRRLPNGVCVHAYSLDGKDRQQRRLLKNWAREYFKERASRDAAVLLVFDSNEVAGEFDWDAFVLTGGSLPNTLPEMLGLRSEALPVQSARSADFDVESLNDYRLFSAREGVAR